MLSGANATYYVFKSGNYSFKNSHRLQVTIGKNLRSVVTVSKEKKKKHSLRPVPKAELKPSFRDNARKKPNVKHNLRRRPQFIHASIYYGHKHKCIVMNFILSTLIFMCIPQLIKYNLVSSDL